MASRQRCGLGDEIAARTLALTLFFAPLVALGQPSASANDADTSFRQGIELANGNRYLEAIERFKASYAVDPARGTLLAMALAEEKSERLGAAYGHYALLVTGARQAGDTERERIASERVAALEPRIGKITLHLGPEFLGRVVRMDGEAVSSSNQEVVVPVDAGTHRVTAQALDGTTFEQSAAVRAGEAARVEVQLPGTSSSAASGPSTAPPPARREPPTNLTTHPSSRIVRFVGWSAIAAGVAAEALGTYLWLESGAIYDQVKSACAGGACASGERDRVATGKTLETWAQVGWIGGGAALLAGAAVLLFVAPNRAPSPGSAYGPVIGIAPDHVSLSGSF